MEFFDGILALFPVVATTAILIRYLVEFGKKYLPFVASNPGRAQAILNAVAWLGLGLAAYYGVQDDALNVVARFTDAMPGLLGLLELLIPIFLSVLATKGVHEALKRTESRPLDRLDLLIAE